MSKPLSADRRNMILSGNLIQAILMLAIPVMIALSSQCIT